MRPGWVPICDTTTSALNKSRAGKTKRSYALAVPLDHGKLFRVGLVNRLVLLMINLLL